ncbi:ABC transporter permease [Streptomyces tremellae]|uniref:Transport permease protein n=1 Tax=Streptomyces tremellae TaxID=1124239 RepID=A0ABP7EW03_9ACTN
MTSALASAAPPEGSVEAAVRPIGPVRLGRHTAALTWRTLTAVRHNPESLFLLAIQPLLFLVLTTYVYGGQMVGSSHAYLQYQVAGILGYNAVFATMSGAPALFGDLARGVFDRFRSMPVARTAPLLARYCGDMCLQMLAFALVLGLGFALGFRVESHWWNIGYVILLMIAFSFGMSWVAMAVATNMRSGETVQMLSFMCTFPLVFISGAFVEVNTMPGWLQALVKINPVTWLTASARGLLLGGPVERPVFYTLVSVLVLALLFMPLALRGLARRR